MQFEILKAKKSFPEKVTEFFDILIKDAYELIQRLMSKKKKGGEDYE